MERRQFIKKCCLGAGSVGASVALSGCPGFAANKGAIELPAESFNAAGEMQVERSRFNTGRDHILLAHPHERYPIALMKLAEGEFSACLMRCSHQACETSVEAGIVICPCHGSRFARDGTLLKGPAEESLTLYKVRVDARAIYISGV